MTAHDILVNESKTEVVMLSALRNHQYVQAPVDVVIGVYSCDVTPKPCIRDIGVIIDDTMLKFEYVRRVCHAAHCQIQVIARIRTCLTSASCLSRDSR